MRGRTSTRKSVWRNQRTAFPRFEIEISGHSSHFLLKIDKKLEPGGLYAKGPREVCDRCTRLRASQGPDAKGQRRELMPAPGMAPRWWQGRRAPSAGQTFPLLFDVSGIRGELGHVQDS